VVYIIVYSSCSTTDYQVIDKTGVSFLLRLSEFIIMYGWLSGIALGSCIRKI